MNREEEIKKATEKAMALLLHKDRTRTELTSRLDRAGFSEEAVCEAMSYVDQFGYVDDYRYACNFISFRKESKSAKEMIYKLREKGVSDDIISQAMEEEHMGEELALKNLLRKRLKGSLISDLTYEEKQKHIAYLSRKGFSIHTINRVIEDFDDGME